MLPVGEGTATALVRRFELTGGSSFHVRFTTAADGDLRTSGPAGPAPDLEQTRSALVDLPWTWLRQVHGPEVVLVEQAGDHAGAAADAAVTRAPGTVLAVHTADCGPVALISPEGVVGVAHAGWRGLAAGVLQATVAKMRAAGAGTITGLLGPCICPGCYEFGPAELDQVATALGPGVRGRTRQGGPALDLRAGVRAALAESDVNVPVEVLDMCTACDPGFFSHRARQDAGRQALLVWIDRVGGQAGA